MDTQCVLLIPGYQMTEHRLQDVIDRASIEFDAQGPNETGSDEDTALVISILKAIKQQRADGDGPSTDCFDFSEAICEKM